MSELTRVFVYGTLKRGHCNAYILERGLEKEVSTISRFLGEADTSPIYAMYDCGGYPGLVEDQESGESLKGEVWEVDAETLLRLHQLEDVSVGLYEFKFIQLHQSNHFKDIKAYYYLGNLTGKERISTTWSKERDYRRS